MYSGLFRLGMGRARGHGLDAGRLDCCLRVIAAYMARSPMERGCGVVLLALIPLVCGVRAAELPHRIDALIDSNPLVQRANIGIHVVDLKSARALYARNEGHF